MDGLGWLQDNKQNQHFASPAGARDTCILNLNSEEAAEKSGFKEPCEMVQKESQEARFCFLCKRREGAAQGDGNL